jgi:hypothetical protein
MANLNPMQLLLMLKNGNPQAVAEQIINQNFPNNPQMQQLLQMGKQGNTKGLEQIAQQILGQQGKDFNTEMNNLLNMTKNL